jgi:hypothetical protein
MKKTSQQKPLSMSFAGGLIKHLGLQMYSGPVPAIAELIANAWDAMAKEVKVKLPMNTSLKSSDEVVVEDDGHGMTYEECNEKYLVVGRDRRKDEGDLSQTYKGMTRRKLMSRKGIGKLAGFGIATKVEVRTIKNGLITHFLMDFNAMTSSGNFVQEYEPTLLAENGKRTSEKPGTRITLKDLKISKPIDESLFTASMARRFAILSDPHFSVHLNGKKIKKAEMSLQFRYPSKVGTWNNENIEDAGKIKWWIGFSEKPISIEEARGIVVFARGKLAQAPWFFDISGGTYGQHGLQYMTGEVQADFLDKTDGEDLIATDRATVLWEDDPTAAALKEWGQKKVKELLKEWAEKRQKEKTARPEIKKFLSYGEKLPDRERQIFHDYVYKLTSIPQIDEDEEILDQLVKFGYNALTNSHFLDVIRQINSASATDVQKMVDILSEWDIIEAITAAQQVKGRVEIINKFEEMIKKGVPEKPDMQDYMMKHPWLLNPIWSPLKHEKSLDNILEKQFKVKKTKTKDGRQRLDFFCLAATYQWEVVDLKRPGKKVGRAELEQIQRYVLFLREHGKKTTQLDTKVDRISGVLVYSDIEDGLGTTIEALAGLGIHVLTWDDLLRRTKSLHEEFLNTIKSAAPADDPRIKALDEKPLSSSKRIVRKKKKR